VADHLADVASYATPEGKGGFGRSSRRGRGLDADRPGQGTPTRSVFGRSGLQKSVIGTPGVGAGNAALFADGAHKATAEPMQDDRLLREKQTRFADKLQWLNESRLRELAYPLLQEFMSVESQPGSDVGFSVAGGAHADEVQSPAQIIDAYRALIEITKEVPDALDSTDPRAVKERQYADEYLDENPNSAKSINTRKRIIDGSRRALEKRYVFHATKPPPLTAPAFTPSSNSSCLGTQRKQASAVSRPPSIACEPMSGFGMPGRILRRMGWSCRCSTTTIPGR
jgi:nuclear pore complex protein Nup93